MWVKSWAGPRTRRLLCKSSPVCGEREREGERDGCSTHMLNSECCYSESESEWLEAEVHSASSVTATQVRPSLVGGVERTDGCDTPGLDEECSPENAIGSTIRETMTSGLVKIARYPEFAWTAGKEDGSIEAHNTQTKLRCCKEVEEWLKEDRAEQQHLTSSYGWTYVKYRSE